MRILNRYKETISDGPGLRYSIYLAGCPHRCPGCHNPESWNSDGGVLLDMYILKELIAEIKGNPLLDGITISGGDPFYDPIGLAELCYYLKESTDLPILVYTGYTLEQIEASDYLNVSLPYIDFLMDGPFIQEQYDPSLQFRGSKNQRFIDLKNRRILS